MSHNDIWYKYRMEVMFNGEWREVGMSGDQNQARSILDTEYGGKRDFRIKEAASDQIVDSQERSIIPAAAVFEAAGKFREAAEKLRREYQSLYTTNDSNRFFPERLLRAAMTETARQTTTQQEQTRENRRYEDRKARLARFQFTNLRPEPQRAVFVGIAHEGFRDGFTKVDNTEPREKVNWKEEGF